LERWRERLIGEGDGAISDFLEEHPATDRQQLRTLVRAAKRDTERGKPEAPRKLFRFLRAAVEAGEGADELLADADQGESTPHW
jgi:ribosome-associated protein